MKHSSFAEKSLAHCTMTGLEIGSSGGVLVEPGLVPPHGGEVGVEGGEELVEPVAEGGGLQLDDLGEDLPGLARHGLVLEVLGEPGHPLAQQEDKRAQEGLAPVGGEQLPVVGQGGQARSNLGQELG